MSNYFIARGLRLRRTSSQILAVAVTASLALGMIENMLQAAAIAHGVGVTYRSTPAIELSARFDDNSPMSDAQVTVYAPHEPAKPWLQGKTDADGRFSFVPDADLPGVWQVRVRKSGHGKIVSIPTSDLAREARAVPGENSQASHTLLQKLVMGGLGVWGAVGTALYFSRNPRKEF